MIMSLTKNKYKKAMRKNFNLYLTIIFGCVLAVLILIAKCSESDEKEQIVTTNEAPSEVVKAKPKKMINGYRKERVVLPQVPEETPTDEGFLVVDGTDSVEFCTDILSGHPYRIIIEGERRLPLCKLLNEDGDSTEWDYSTQVLRFANDSVIMARLMVGEQVFQFGLSEDVDSIPQQDFCNFSFAEMVNNKQDSIHSGSTRFPILGSATILFNTASEKADKLYLKVKQPGLINVTVVYDESVCGYPLFWDNDSVKFENGDESEYQTKEKKKELDAVALN